MFTILNNEGPVARQTVGLSRAQVLPSTKLTIYFPNRFARAGHAFSASSLDNGSTSVLNIGSQ